MKQDDPTTVRELIERANERPGDLTPSDLDKLRGVQKKLGAGTWGEAPARSYRESQRRIMQDRREAEYQVTIPPVKDPKRRAKCERSHTLWQETYLSSAITRPFTKDQKKRVTSFFYCIAHGGRKARAAPRGDGKTTGAECNVVEAISRGFLRFPLFVRATGVDAKASRREIMFHFERSDELGEDYPEICTPIRALEGSPQRASRQTLSGTRQRTLLEWSGDFLVFPTVPGSKASGAILAVRPILGAIRGIKYHNLRPDFALVDDIETELSVLSLTETAKRKNVLDRVILGLGDRADKGISVLLNVTILRRDCLADIYTDRKRQPSWLGERQKQLITLPSNGELWEKYIDLRQTDQFADDPNGRTAHKFYINNQAKMDAGATVSNQYNLDRRKCTDGSQLESSALESCYNVIADSGWDVFKTEYQNEPPDHSDPDAQRLEYRDIQTKLNGLPRGVVPAWAEAVTVYVDVHGRHIDWVVLASKQGLAGAVVDYGADPVNSPLVGKLTSEDNREAVELAVLSALREFRDRERETGWPTEGTGELRHADIVLVDSGWKPDPVHLFIKETRGTVYRASLGRGSNENAKYRSPTKRSKERRTGFHFFASYNPARKAWAFELDVDYWKRFVHDAFATAVPWREGADAKPEPPAGTLHIFGDSPIRHNEFAKQMLAEVWRRDWLEGKGWKEYFEERSRRNHYLDGVAGCLAGAAMVGIRIVGQKAKLPTRKRKRVEVKNW